MSKAGTKGRELARTGGRGLTTARTPSRLVDEWLRAQSPSTRRAYGQDLEAFCAFVGVTGTQAAAELLLSAGHGAANELALSYRTHLVERGLAPATVNRHLASLRSLVALGRTLGLVAWTLEVGNLRAERLRDSRGPGRNAVRSMLEVLEARQDAKAIRDAALLRLLYDLALRRAEAASLDVEHVDVPGTRVEVLRKGKRERVWLSLPARTVQALELWLRVRGPAPGPLFTGFRGGKGKRLAGGGVYRAVRGMGAAVGAKVRPHGLRHTAVTSAVKAAREAGLDLEEVLDFSGHADVRTLMVYRDRERNVQGQLAELVAGGV